MAILVDTVVSGVVELPISAKHAVMDRIDIVYVRDGKVGILEGTPSYSPAPPALATGMRRLALIKIWAHDRYITENNIMETL
jgi:hypothetical protein